MAYLINLCLANYRHPHFIFKQILRQLTAVIGSLHLLFFAVYFSTILLLFVFFFVRMDFLNLNQAIQVLKLYIFFQ